MAMMHRGSPSQRVTPALAQLPGRLEVWAPHASRVEVSGPFGRLPMHPVDDPGILPGHHRLEHDAFVHGVQYAFHLDGGDARPDPRSRHQPHGVHGPSRLVDPATFTFEHPFRPPLLGPESLIYELHVGTFSSAGTFDGATAHLDALVDLGVTHVEVMPVNAFPGGRGWGYDGVGIFAVQDAYGGPEAFARFVDACHGRGLAVILDVVYNHLGPDGNYLGQFGPYSTDEHSTPWGPAINMDRQGSSPVRAFIVDNALQWLRDYRVDGLRLDAVDRFHDDSALHLLDELRLAAEALGRSTGQHYAIIAEHDLADPRVCEAPSAGGHGMDGEWCDDFHHAVHAFMTGERFGYYADYGPLDAVADTLAHGYRHRGQYSAYRGRCYGRADRPPQIDHLLGYVQTHDQVGNRPGGERLAHLVGPKRARQAAALLFCSPFIPMLFQGEEWAASAPFFFFTDFHHGLGRLVDDGRKGGFRHFGYPSDASPHPNDPATMERCRLGWAERDRGDHAMVLRAHRELMELRRQHRDLRRGHLAVTTDPAERWLRLRRGACELLVAFADGVRLPLGDARTVLVAWEARVEGDAAVLDDGGVLLLSPATP